MSTDLMSSTNCLLEGILSQIIDPIVKTDVRILGMAYSRSNKPNKLKLPDLR